MSAPLCVEQQGGGTNAKMVIVAIFWIRDPTSASSCGAKDLVIGTRLTQFSYT